MAKKKVLFVCRGNICRSPIAEAVLLHLLDQEGLEDDWVVDSAATHSWDVGQCPDPRALNIMKKYKILYRPEKMARVVRI